MASFNHQAKWQQHIYTMFSFLDLRGNEAHRLKSLFLSQMNLLRDQQVTWNSRAMSFVSSYFVFLATTQSTWLERDRNGDKKWRKRQKLDGNGRERDKDYQQQHVEMYIARTNVIIRCHCGSSERHTWNNMQNKHELAIFCHI